MNSKDDIQVGTMLWVSCRIGYGGDYVLAEVARETKTQWVLDICCRVRKKDLRAIPSNKFINSQVATKEELDYVSVFKGYSDNISEAHALASSLRRQYEERIRYLYPAGPNVTSGLPSEYADKLSRATLLMRELLAELEALPK